MRHEKICFRGSSKKCTLFTSADGRKIKYPMIQNKLHTLTDWQTDLHEDLIGRTDMIERMGDRIGIWIEYGPGITTDTRIDNGSDLDLKSVEEGNFWFRYWPFSDMKKISVIFMWSVSSFHSIHFTSKETRHTTHVSILSMRLQSFQNKSSKPRWSALSPYSVLMSTSLGPLMTWNFVRSLICSALLTNLCCSTAALYCYALLSRCITVLCCCALSKRSATLFCCCALLLRCTGALHWCTPLLRFTLTLYAYPLLLRFPLSNTSYKSVILETTTDSDTVRLSDRLR